jgi:hypothetical protein
VLVFRLLLDRSGLRSAIVYVPSKKFEDENKMLKQEIMSKESEITQLKAALQEEKHANGRLRADGMGKLRVSFLFSCVGSLAGHSLAEYFTESLYERGLLENVFHFPSIDSSRFIILNRSIKSKLM